MNHNINEPIFISDGISVHTYYFKCNCVKCAFHNTTWLNNYPTDVVYPLLFTNNKI